MNPRVFVVALLFFSGARVEAAGPVEVRVGARRWRMEPATLKLETVSDAGRTLSLSAGQAHLGPVTNLNPTPDGATWKLVHAGAAAEFRVEGEEAIVRLTLDGPGRITWPVVAPDANVQALLLPRAEGIRIPPGDTAWTEILGDNTLTEEFSLPCFGLDLGPQTVSYLVPDPFDTDISYPRVKGRMGVSLTRRFTRLDSARVWEVRVAFGPGSPLEPARRYRAWLIAQGRFVSLADKIAQVPLAGRLPGAMQAYLWGLCLAPENIRTWKTFTKILADAPGADAASPLGQVWEALPPEGRKAVTNYLAAPEQEEWLQLEVTRALAEQLAHGTLVPETLIAAFPGLLTEPATWGNGLSESFLETIHAAGIDRACLTLNDLHTGDTRPEIARVADRLGYVYGPYDCYDSVHKPGAKNSWESAQFDTWLYEHGGILKEDGKPGRGFQNTGHQLSPLAARPYVEKRVRAEMEKVPFSMLFMDCDAAGQYFDDFSPEHPANQATDCAAKVDRMRWIATTFGIPIGSEGGSAVAAGVICFAHGMLTGAIGDWVDPDFKNEKSKYFLGSWYPPEAPDVFFKKVAVKARTRLEMFDPRYRLPLYEAAFHDSVIATHHWLTPSLKFKGVEATAALLEQLYNVPALYHLTRAVFSRNQAAILAHYRFFSPLHRRLALQPLTEFDCLTADRLVQRTRFGDGTEIIANFTDHPWHGNGLDIPAGSVMSRLGSEASSYMPCYP